MKRTRLLVSLFAALAILAAACGSDDTADDASTGDTDGELTTEQVSLTVWSWLPNDHDEGPATYDAIIANFEEEYPNVTVKLEAMPFPTFWDTWSTATIAGSGPDVISMYGGATAVAYADSLEPLQDSMSTESLDNLRFVSSSFSPDGNLYSVPAGAYAYHLLVNQSIVADAGLDPSTAFADWDSLLASCSALSEAGLTPLASGWADGFVLENYMYVFMSQLLDEDSFDSWVAGKLGMDDPRFAQAMDYILDMAGAGCFSEASIGMNLYYDAFDSFASGDAAAVVSGDGSLALDAEANNGEGSMFLMTFPQLPDSHYDNVSDAGPNQGWSVTAWSEQKDYATLLVEHIVSPESQALLWENTQLPPNSAGAEATSDDPLINDYLAIINQPENHTTFMAFTDSALAIFQREASNLITGRTDPADILSESGDAHARALGEIGG